MSQQQVNITDLDLPSLQQVKTQLEEVRKKKKKRERDGRVHMTNPCFFFY